ncbi:protein artichoke-like [Venturia canescens]|uniref:protein artichoke-like n=1 Tax=Venturia canescens TaxID=32260 RepID=UPI001C9C6291|nr:protein artichoke-like [Venturia canescens]
MIGLGKRFLLIVIISFLGSIETRQTIAELLRVVRSINSYNDEPDIPSGKCGDQMNQRHEISAYLTRTCVSRIVDRQSITSNWLTCLSLRDCQIEEIRYGSFSNMANLYYLDLSKNRIQYCDLLSFGGHENLRTLIVDENGANGINNRGLTINRADFFPRLEHLYIRKNYLNRLRISIGQWFPVLTHLYLSDNLLTSESLNDLTSVPISLTHIHLERNRIRRVESSLIRSLRYVFLDGNAINSICRTNCYENCVDLRAANELRFLSLSKNEISRVEIDSFVDTWNLRSLNLDRNKLESFAIGTFDQLRQLEDLSLSHNLLRYVPILHHATVLTSLTLNYNYIDRIQTDAFRDLYRLKWLSLNNNRLRIIEEGAFRNLRSLEDLDLSNNKLDYFSPLWIDSETPLRTLDLRNNRFTTYDHLYLRNLLFLNDLYIQGNPLARSPSCYDFPRNVSVHGENGLMLNMKPCRIICT